MFWRALIYFNRSVLPSVEDVADPPALLGSDGAGTREAGAAEGCSSGAEDSATKSASAASAMSVMVQAHEASERRGVERDNGGCT